MKRLQDTPITIQEVKNVMNKFRKQNVQTTVESDPTQKLDLVIGTWTNYMLLFCVTFVMQGFLIISES